MKKLTYWVCSSGNHKDGIEYASPSAALDAAQALATMNAKAYAIVWSDARLVYCMLVRSARALEHQAKAEEAFAFQLQEESKHVYAGKN